MMILQLWILSLPPASPLNCILTSCVFFLFQTPKEASRRPSTSNPFCIRSPTSLFFMVRFFASFLFLSCPSYTFIFLISIFTLPFLCFLRSTLSISFIILNAVSCTSSIQCFCKAIRRLILLFSHFHPFSPFTSSSINSFFSFPRKQYITKNMTGKELIIFPCFLIVSVKRIWVKVATDVKYWRSTKGIFLQNAIFLLHFAQKVQKCSLIILSNSFPLFMIWTKMRRPESNKLKGRRRDQQQNSLVHINSLSLYRCEKYTKCIICHSKTCLILTLDPLYITSDSAAFPNCNSFLTSLWQKILELHTYNLKLRSKLGGCPIS